MKVTVRRRKTAEAIFASPENWEEIRSMLREDGQPFIEVSCPQHNVPIFVLPLSDNATIHQSMDWIVQEEEDTFAIVGPKRFRDMYEAVDGELPDPPVLPRHTSVEPSVDFSQTDWSKPQA